MSVNAEYHAPIINIAQILPQKCIDHFKKGQHEGLFPDNHGCLGNSNRRHWKIPTQ
jgi:hypothetical protein